MTDSEPCPEAERVSGILGEPDEADDAWAWLEGHLGTCARCFAAFKPRLSLDSPFSPEERDVLPEVRDELRARRIGCPPLRVLKRDLPASVQRHLEVCRPCAAERERLVAGEDLSRAPR